MFLAKMSQRPRPLRELFDRKHFKTGEFRWALRCMIRRILKMKMQKAKQFIFDMYEKTDEEILEECKFVSKRNANAPFKGNSVCGQICKVLFEVFSKPHLVKNEYVYLDIGCSDGEITRMFAKTLNVLSKNAHGLDIADQPNYKKGSVFNQYDGKSLPFGDDSVDFITAIQVMHHVEHLDDLISEINRVLKPGGYLIIKDHDCNSDMMKCLMNIEHKLYTVTEKCSVTEKTESDFDFPIVNYMSREQLALKFATKGIICVNESPINEYPTRVYISVFQKN